MAGNWPEIQHAATEAAARGWPIVPGTYGYKGRWYGRAGATELVPIADDWQDSAITDPERAGEAWAGRPYGVLLVCGLGVDALECPAAVAPSLPGELVVPGLRAPVAVVFPPPRWLVLVASGAPLHPDLAAAGVTLRGAGDWVALPPTYLGQARARWRTLPGAGQAVPGSAEVQDAIVAAFAGLVPS